MVSTERELDGPPHQAPNAKHWGPHAAYIVRVEDTEAWKPFASSMTDWMRMYAKQIGKSLPVMWRYKASGRYYQAKRAYWVERGVSLPGLGQIPTAVSAEALELLERVERVVAAELLEQIELKVLQGEFKKSELNRLWQQNKHLLGGRSARGIGVERPRVEITQDILDRQRCLGLISRNISEIARSGSFMVKQFDRARFERSGLLSGLDMIGLEPSAGLMLTIHGFEIVNFARASGQQRFGTQRLKNRYIHYYWIVSIDPPTQEQLSRVDPGVGVLVVSDGIELIRKPTAVVRELSDGERLLGMIGCMLIDDDERLLPR